MDYSKLLSKEVSIKVSVNIQNSIGGFLKEGLDYETLVTELYFETPKTSSLKLLKLDYEEELIGYKYTFEFVSKKGIYNSLVEEAEVRVARQLKRVLRNKFK